MPHQDIEQYHLLKKFPYAISDASMFMWVKVCNFLFIFLDAVPCEILQLFLYIVHFFLYSLQQILLKCFSAHSYIWTTCSLFLVYLFLFIWSCLLACPLLFFFDARYMLNIRKNCRGFRWSSDFTREYPSFTLLSR